MLLQSILNIASFSAHCWASTIVDRHLAWNRVPKPQVNHYPAQACLGNAQVRHPNILAFKDTLELEEKHETVIYVVTEPVTPLEELLAELDVQGEARCACAPLTEQCSRGWPVGMHCCGEGPAGQAGFRQAGTYSGAHLLNTLCITCSGLTLGTLKRRESWGSCTWVRLSRRIER